MTATPEQARVGDYRLLTRLGEGGMGVVHLAQGPDGRRVALKVLRAHLVGDEEGRERLAREVSTLRRITSPRIAEIIDADPHGPVPYVVTRYVPGLSLYHHLQEEGPVEGRDLLHLADGLAEALHAVHSVGVLHRDVKPTNVLMEGRSPVLIDFGLARLAEDPRLTHTGWLLGTPGYLAPEILYGDDASPASDMHSWAATVAFAATGRPPYGQGPAMAVMDRVRRGEHELSGVPEPLRGLLREVLAPEPLERPSLLEVRGWLAGEREKHLPRAAAPSAAEREQWTMPFAPAVEPDQPPTEVRPLLAPVGAASPAPVPAPARVVDPVADTPAQSPPVSEVPMRPAAPYQQPAPPTRVLPPPGQRQAPPAWQPPPPVPAHRAQRRLQVLALGVLVAGAVAYAPYLGTLLVAVVVLLLRSSSVGRQRHGRRQLVRGRARWYDVPTTTVSSPGYAVLALPGTAAAVGLGALCALAMLSVGYLLGQPPRHSLVLAGVGFVPALWWGPGSGRVREVVHRLTWRTSRTEFGGWFLAAMAVLGGAVLVALLLTEGPNWAPAVGAPWQ